MPVYTRKGDDGYTAVLGGKKIKKGADLFEFLGCLDELNVALGFVLSEGSNLINKKDLEGIQYDLFLLGSVCSGYKVGENFYSYLGARVSWFEKEIDHLESLLPRLNKFIMLGENKLSLHIHWARVLSRKCERRLVSLNKYNRLIPYLNRLSDYLFVLARFVHVKSSLSEKLVDINFDQL